MVTCPNKYTVVGNGNWVVERMHRDRTMDTIARNGRFRGGPVAGDTLTCDSPQRTGPTYGESTGVITTALRVIRGKHRNHRPGRTSP